MEADLFVNDQVSRLALNHSWQKSAGFLLPLCYIHQQRTQVHHGLEVDPTDVNQPQFQSFF